MQIICTSRLTEELYELIVNVIISANSDAFKVVSGMCEALERIYGETLGEKYRKMYDEKNQKMVTEKEAELKQKDAYILEKMFAMQKA